MNRKIEPGLGRVVPTVGLAALILAPAVAAQSASDVLETAMNRYAERVAGVENYTVVQEAMGFTATSYYVKKMVDGRPFFELQSQYGEGEPETGPGEFYNEFGKLVDRASSEGTATVDGHECHVVTVDDFSGLDFGGDEEDQQFKPRKGTFYLDSDDYVLRKMVMEGDMDDGDQMRPVTMEALFQDYQEVESMLHPFRTTLTIHGMQGAVSEEELQQARQALEEMEKRLDEMPESQRSMMESMLKSQMEQLRNIVDSGQMQITMQVKDLKVNAGPPQN